jgi:hypothetical protein
VPTHKFKSYVCTGVEDYAAQGVAKADVLVERTPFQREKEEMEHVEVRENETKGQPK